MGKHAKLVGTTLTGTTLTAPSTPPANRSTSEQPNVESKEQTLLRRAQDMLESGDVELASQILSAAGDTASLRNARAVCLMHQGRHADALAIFRGFMFKAGCVWVIPELPTLYKTNFATCLLLTGHPGGCKTLLQEINDEKNPQVQKIRSELAAWEKTLPFFSWLNWKLGGIDPPNHKFVTVNQPLGRIQ